MEQKLRSALIIMNKLIIILTFSIVAHAGKTSQCSEVFILKDPQYTTQQERGNKGLAVQFDLYAQPNPFNSSITLSVSGIVPNKTHLGIYRIDGKLLEDFSTSMHSGFSTIVWNVSDLPTGLFLAKLHNGNKTKIIKIFRSK